MKWKRTLLLAYSLAALLIPSPAKGEGTGPPAYEIEVFHLQENGGVSDEGLIYRAKHFLRTFTVYAEGRTADRGYAHPQFFISADGVSYRSVTPDIHEEESRSAVTYESRNFPGDTKYLKITLPDGNGKKAPLIRKVVLNGPSSVLSSVPSGTVPYGRMVMLNRAADGDTVYYTTDGSDPRDSPTRLFYNAPIPVLSDLVLKVTAVNHSGTGRSAAGRVSTYRYDVDGPVAAPPPGLIDPLDDFRRTAQRSNLYIAKDHAGYYGNDAGRAVRATAGPGSLVYRADEDLTSFTIYGSWFTGVPIEKLRVFVSADGKAYEEVNAQSYAAGYPESGWQPYACEARDLPAHTRYLKIELSGSAKAWTPQVTKVVLNRDTASVKMASTPDGGAVLAALSSETKGARVYYRLDKGADFLPYTEPLRLQGYRVLETYAVKDGLEPSPIRKYTLNSGGQIQIDEFGQLQAAQFSGKVKSDGELKADAQADAAYYGSLKPPADRDRYGGLAGSAEQYGLAPTGYFAVQRLGGRPVLTTPGGNLYFSLAVNGITAQETYTQVKGRESRFASVPPYQSEYRRAYLGRDNFSFYLANKYRKSGVFPTEHSLYMEAVDRLAKWGFNGVGGYSPEKYGEEGKLPYVRMLPLSSLGLDQLPGISIFDIFASGAAERIDAAFAQALPPHADDKMLIGYFIGNEYEYHKFYTQVPKLKASAAAIKGALVDSLRKEYGSIEAFNAAWRTDFRSFGELNEAELTLRTSESWRDMDAFFSSYLDAFYRTVSQAFHKYDPHHLLLGDRWITTTFHNEKIRGMLSEAQGKYVDVISINYYTYKIETDLLQDVYEKSGGRPILMSEFGYGTGEQGLEPLMKNAASNQFQRGMRYRNYVEGVARLPYVVGAHLFNYVDQAGLGRYWQGEWGERYNSGLVNVADRPYKEYLQAVKATNDDIYKVVLGQRPPFYYDFSQK